METGRGLPGNSDDIQSRYIGATPGEPDIGDPRVHCGALSRPQQKPPIRKSRGIGARHYRRPGQCRLRDRAPAYPGNQATVGAFSGLRTFLSPAPATVLKPAATPQQVLARQGSLSGPGYLRPATLRPPLLGASLLLRHEHADATQRRSSYRRASGGAALD